MILEAHRLEGDFLDSFYDLSEINHELRPYTYQITRTTDRTVRINVLSPRGKGSRIVSMFYYGSRIGLHYVKSYPGWRRAVIITSLGLPHVNTFSSYLRVGMPVLIFAGVAENRGNFTSIYNEAINEISTYNEELANYLLLKLGIVLGASSRGNNAISTMLGRQ